MSEEKKEEQGFTVSDRRRFRGSGDSAEAAPAHAVEEKPVEKPSAETGGGSAPEPESRATGDAKKQEAGAGRQESAPLPEINFATFVVSLSSSALIHLGLAEDPMSGQARKDLGLAKQTIDILGMLKEKTAGNLNEEEKGLLEGVLYDLRIRYVEERKR